MTETKKRRSPVLLLLALVALAASLGLGFVGLRGLSLALAESDWPATEATIRVVETGKKERVSRNRNQDPYVYVIFLRYDYAIDGKSYSGERYSSLEPNETFSDAKQRDRKVAALKKKGTLTVFYNPEDPAQAIVFKSELAPAAVVSVLALLALVGALVLSLLWLRSSKQAA